MITDKEYRIDKKTYLIIAGTLAYTVLPTDIVPDFIPGIGFLDDTFVIGSKRRLCIGGVFLLFRRGGF